MYNIEEFISRPGKIQAIEEAVKNPGPEAFLLSAKIKLTHRCNLKCRMCGFWKYSSQKELDPERASTLVEDLHSMGCRKVHFSGGEPLLRTDIFDLIEQCTRLKIRANLTTNGTLVNKETAKRLIKSGARGISISIDGPDNKTHDRIRGVKGAFKAAVNAIEMLASARENYSGRRRIRIRVNTVLQRMNWRDLPRIVELAGSLGVDDQQPMPVDSKRGEPRLKKSELKDYNICVAPEIEALRKKFGFSSDEIHVYPFGKTKRDLKYAIGGDYALGFYEKNLCYAPWLHAFVMWDGRVFPCCMTRGRMPSLGNVSRSSIQSVFTGDKYSRLRKDFVKKRLPFCNKCDNFLHENRMLAASLTEKTAPQ